MLLLLRQGYSEHFVEEIIPFHSCVTICAHRGPRPKAGGDISKFAFTMAFWPLLKFLIMFGRQNELFQLVYSSYRDNMISKWCLTKIYHPICVQHSSPQSHGAAPSRDLGGPKNCRVCLMWLAKCRRKGSVPKQSWD